MAALVFEDNYLVVEDVVLITTELLLLTIYLYEVGEGSYICLGRRSYVARA
ncbi:hypothetical protein PTT_15779 [Pyrenophora teres f. teres 0-1]|uniref:Uncharacterized protein n=1 Tax=Pyrenophora teres f. teres (strain 0-1) TaxID=861557 RepID=E3S0Y2_PYRTT|nr:hypothetical protein PTT_15779 [Pyrenophora teres f. teres 0-1]